jgi:hypothetical protein
MDKQTECEHQWGESYYPTCAYLWAVFVFPIGILCCLRMKVRNCVKCGEELEDENGQNQPIDTPAYKVGYAIGAVSEVLNKE